MTNMSLFRKPDFRQGDSLVSCQDNPRNVSAEQCLGDWNEIHIDYSEINQASLKAMPLIRDGLLKSKNNH